MLSPNSAFAKLAELGRKLETIEHAQAMLGVDEAVMWGDYFFMETLHAVLAEM